MLIESKPCNVTECPRTYVPHRWGAIKAHADGWFIQKDGTAWCPDHPPAWLKAWRARSAAAKEPPSAEPG